MIGLPRSTYYRRARATSDRLDQRLLVVEVLVERGRCNADLCGEAPHRYAGDALGDVQLECCVEGA